MSSKPQDRPLILDPYLFFMISLLLIEQAGFHCCEKWKVYAQKVIFDKFQLSKYLKIIKL